jgi:DNA polymerase alpha subunit A
MNDLLGDIGANIKAPVARPVKRERSRDKRRTRDLSPAHALQFPAAKKKKVVDDHIPSPSSPVAGSPLDDVFAVPHMDDDDAMVAPSDPILPSSPPARDVAVKRSTAFADNDDDDGDYDMEVSHAVAANIANVNIASSRPVVKKEPVETPSASVVPTAPDAKVDSSSWNRITDQLNVISGAEPRPIGKLNPADVAEEDGSLNFFWTDYTEINGSLCLFGKVRNKKTRAYGSCFVKIDSILRTLYFLPRTRRVRFGQEMEEEVGIHDVQEEVSTLIKQLKAEPFSLKTSERKYAFELPGIPEQATYVKVRYPYTKPAVDTSTAAGETFSHVFGTNTALFEQFVLWKNIMGPCWLKIKSPDFEALKNASHCKMDVLVSDPGCMSTSMDDEEPPPLTLMSMAMRTVFNAKENKQEILAVSARVYENVSLSDTTPAEKLPCRQFTLVRPSGDAFPFGFDTLARKRSRGTIRMTRQENELLAVFLAQLDLADPDVILGHQLEGVDYSILLNRLHEKKVPQWSRIGRFRRTQWPASIGRVANNVFAERSVMAGRLLCDLSNDCGKSTMYKCTTWSLTEMCELYLSADNKRREVDNEVALKTWATTKDGLMDYIAHLEADTYFITALALRVQLLPLTQVLTNLAGNSWARTLTGTRAERNEYILLHEFHRNKYICPDKQGFVKGQQGKQKQSQSQQQQQQQQQQRGNDDEDEENGGAEGAKKKDRYKGGLVFEPEKGLYDKFVLVMDFNSLYPSIIQEFNICFTTVERSNLVGDSACLERKKGAYGFVGKDADHAIHSLTTTTMAACPRCPWARSSASSLGSSRRSSSAGGRSRI